MANDISRTNILDFSVIKVVNGAAGLAKMGGVPETDARLDDARVPTPHTHDAADITDLAAGVAALLEPYSNHQGVLVDVDFGTTESDFVTQDFGADWISGRSLLTAAPFGRTTDHDPDDAILEGLTCAVSDVSEGQATLHVHAPYGTHGRYTIAVTGSA